jgi:hypothetical protein
MQCYSPCAFALQESSSGSGSHYKLFACDTAAMRFSALPVINSYIITLINAD